MNNENTLSGRPIFCKEGYTSSLRRVLSLVQGVFPDLEGPERQHIDDGGTVHFFSGPEDMKLRVGEWANGEVRFGMQLTLVGQYLAIPAHGELLCKLGKNWQWAAEEKDGRWLYRVTTQFAPGQIGGIQETLLRSQLEELHSWADKVSPTESAEYDESAALNAYGKLTEVASPVFPWICRSAPAKDLEDWAENIAELLTAGINVAIPAEEVLEQELALAILANQLYHKSSHFLGLVQRSALDASTMVQLASKAPGTLAVAARVLQMGSQAYQLGNEALNLLASLSAQTIPVVFFGSFSELQRVFHGGQGASNDPLQPVVCRLPELPLETMISFATTEQCRKEKIGNAQFESDVCNEVAEALKDFHEANARHLTSQTVAYVVNSRIAGKGKSLSRKFAHKLDGCAETLGGLSRQPRAKRLPAVQERMIERITHRDFLPFLEKDLLGQSHALREYHMKLIREVTTRPSHQPLRLSALGEPGTGKSRILELIAQWLGVPYVNIDMASLSDPHMAMTQLLGSGTGFVGSDQAGRLETVARHFKGAVVECSDLDHAHPSVQSTVGDMFLSVFETGEAQSGRGYMFSCANLIFGFTLNLPDGKDERMYERMGFGRAPSKEEVRKNVRRELKQLMSGAFWSRMGDPVLFAPLTGEVRTEIVCRAIRDAAQTGLERFGVPGAQVEITPRVAASVLENNEAPGTGFGARGLLELARTQAACAVTTYVQSGASLSQDTYEVAITADGLTVLRTKN